MSTQRHFLGCLIFIAVIGSALSLRVAGDHRYGHQFTYLGKFCFEEYHKAMDKHGSGDAYVRITAKAEYPSTAFVLYYDDDSSWQSAELNLPCTDRLRLARQSWYPNKMVEGKIIETMEWPLQIQDEPRFWYIAAINCENSEIGPLKFELHFENPGNFFHAEISVDKQGVLEMNLFYSLFYLFFIVLHIYTILALHRTRSYHTIVQLLTYSIFATYFSVVSNTFALILMAMNGYQSNFLEAGGVFFEFAADLLFCILLILLCQGWTISTMKIKNMKMVTFAVSFLSFFFLVMYIWDEYFTSGAHTTYIYETWPGTIICTVRFILMLWCWNLLYDTYSEEVHPDKRKFYKRVALVFSPWFVSLPIIVFFAHHIPPYMRYVTVEAVEITWTTLLYIVLQWLLWPTKASEYFRLTPEEQDVLGTTPYDDL